MFKKTITSLLLTSALFFVACSDDKTKSDEIAKDANSLISKNEFVLTALDNKQYVVKKEGSDFILKGAEGKVVLFDIFATWCPPCRGAATHLTSLQEKYKDDLIVIGISIEEAIENSKLLDFRNEYNANYTLVNSDQNRRLADTIVNELKLGDRYPIPVMALYKDGKYINHFIGSIEEELIESDIKLAINK
ncbi:lipoprotein thioredoxin [Sulfurimonas hongkongensis]|uniref:Lipoprotein thioredoxin n=1 Tax=Sulfurimonas hongkongensis TaxID=1172190 RepID=T0JF51_9BACT|nr:TlpA disulfide reductase family protein [Sulfurimonas hongkongensis]EQB35492.1 lipoprotein thioredoxin [Sulfurimonas hongkongensis]